MKNVMASAGLVALGAFSIQTANAQSQMLSSETKPWSISGTLRGFYDDNYTTSPDGTNRLSSFGFEVKPSASVNLSLPATTIKASYFMDMRYYDDRPSDKADYSHDFELYLKHAFNDHFGTELSDSFVIAQEPELLSPNDLTVKTRVNGNNMRNTGMINFTAKATDELSFILGYANTLYSYDQSYSDLSPADKAAGTVSRAGALDRIEQTASLSVRYALTRETSLGFGYQFGDVDYTSSEQLSAPLVTPSFTSSIRNNRSHYVYTGVDHYFLPELSGSLRVGVQYTDYYNDPASSSSFGPYVDLSGSYSYRDDGSVTIGFTHRRNQTDLIGGTLSQVTSLQALTLDQESSSFYASLSQKITPKLTGTLTGQYQVAQFNGGSASVGGINGETDQFVLLGLNLSYQFTRFISGELGYNYDNLSSDIVNRSYDRNRVYVGVTASY